MLENVNTPSTDQLDSILENKEDDDDAGSQTASQSENESIIHFQAPLFPTFDEHDTNLPPTVADLSFIS